MKPRTTKLSKLLADYGLKQIDLIALIEVKQGKVIPKGRMSNIVSGKQRNVELDTLRVIARALEVPVTDIIDE